MKLKKMFSQFNPTSILSFPLTLIGALIAMSWFITNHRSHWSSNRTSSMKIFLQTSFKTLLGDLTGKKAKWSPWLFSMFILCLSYNILSLIPYTFSQTSHLSITFSMSLPMWLALQMAGFQHNWKAKMSHLLPQGTPIYLIPLMIMMETISLLIQPLTLGFRLGANLLAGHLLIFLCSCTMWEAIKASKLGIISIVLMLTLLMLEMAVACMQAAVFIMLSKKYLEDKMN